MRCCGPQLSGIAEGSKLIHKAHSKFLEVDIMLEIKNRQ